MINNILEYHLVKSMDSSNTHKTDLQSAKVGHSSGNQYVLQFVIRHWVVIMILRMVFCIFFLAIYCDLRLNILTSEIIYNKIIGIIILNLQCYSLQVKIIYQIKWIVNFYSKRKKCYTL